MENLKEKYLQRIDEITSKAKQDIEVATKEYKEELAEKDNGQWIPKFREVFWTIGGYGNVFSDLWDFHMNDKNRLAIGNVFKTEEEAEFEVERLKILAIMNKYSRPFKLGKYNYSIYYNSLDKKILTTSYVQRIHNPILFETEEIAQKVIDEIGEVQLKKYYFRVEEGR